MKIVEKRIQNLYGQQYAMEITCVPDQLTRVTLVLPAPRQAAA